MIPVRVGLSNFLTYATAADGGPVIFDFEGAVLWSIAGDNGAGKSTVFDAVTYALFGEHRGGRQQDRRLVRKGTTEMEAFFEFTHQDQLWRVRRTVSLANRRKGGTEERKTAEVAFWDASLTLWIPVPGADSARRVDEWVTSNVGLRAEVFKSTVLLEQGGADRLLTVDPSVRFKILAGLVDLDIYHRLEEAAAARRRSADVTVKSVDSQLGELEQVTDDALDAAAAQVRRADTELRSAVDGELVAAATVVGASQYAKLRAEADSLADRVRQLQGLLSQSECIRADAARAIELSVVIPALRDAGASLDDAAAADGAEASAMEELSGIDQVQFDQRVLQADGAVDTTNAALQAIEGEDDLFRTWQPLLERRLALRLKVTRCQAAADAAGDPNVLAASVAHLTERVAATRAAINRVEAEQEALRDEAANLQARTDHVAQVIAERRCAAVEATCLRCGQKVDADHIASDLAELSAAKKELRAKAADAAERRNKVTAELGRIRTAETSIGNELNAVRKHLEIAASALAELATATAELDAQLTQELPDRWAEAERDTAAAARLCDRFRALPADLRAARKTASDAVTRRDVEQRRAHEAQLRASRLRGEALRQNEAAKGARAAASARLSGVPDTVTAAFTIGRDDLVAEFEAEASKLEGASNRLARLIDAESDEHTAVSRGKTVAEELLGFPAEHQVSVDDAQGALDAQRERVASATVDRDTRRDALGHLQEKAKRLSELEQRRAASARSGTVAGRLERLLGRSGLQGALLNQAVGGVEDLANETLSRLTGGALSVSLAVDETTDAGKLEILVTDAASADEPLEAVFVSGSQRFRVAVALAAGLGQFLGGPEAVRALIIDEGFGSLDESGRDEMIAELHNLAEHLDRVIVVSHHSDFSDAARFPHGFKLRKVGRHTEVSRMM